LFQQEPDKQAVSLFLNWFRQLAIHGRIDREDYLGLEKIYNTTQEVGMLLTSLREERERLINQGIAQGINQGVVQGAIETAKRMLDKKIDISIIAEVTLLSEQEILQLKTEQNDKHN